MQKILEAENHTKRVELMQYFVDAERKRLQARKTLKSIFSGVSSNISSESEEKSRGQGSNEVESQSKSQFFDDADAWQ
jgi:hypothetical protein